MDGDCDGLRIILKVMHSDDDVRYVSLLLGHCPQSALKPCHLCKSVITKNGLSPHTLTHPTCRCVTCVWYVWQVSTGKYWPWQKPGQQGALVFYLLNHFYRMLSGSSLETQQINGSKRKLGRISIPPLTLNFNPQSQTCAPTKYKCCLDSQIVKLRDEFEGWIALSIEIPLDHSC